MLVHDADIAPVNFKKIGCGFRIPIIYDIPGGIVFMDHLIQCRSTLEQMSNNNCWDITVRKSVNPQLDIVEYSFYAYCHINDFNLGN